MNKNFTKKIMILLVEYRDMSNTIFGRHFA